MKGITLSILLLSSTAFGQLGPSVRGNVLTFGPVDAGTLPAPLLGGLIYDVVDSKVLYSDGGTWAPVLSLPPAPFFSFAVPIAYNGYAAYAGLPATGCESSSNVTSTKGAASTFTRASVSSCCTDGTSNCATVEQCASNEMCINNYGVRSFWNYAVNTQYSEEFDNAYWSKLGEGGGTAPSVTADYGTAPDGTSTADRITWNACSAGQANKLQRAAGFSNLGESVWVKATPGGSTSSGGNLSLCSYVGGCTQFAFTTAWKQITRAPGGVSYVQFGCINDTANYPGSGDTGAADVLVWGFNGAEFNFAYVPPYAKTTSANLTVPVEVLSFGVTWAGATLALRATYDAPATFSANATIAELQFDANNYTQMYVTTTHATTSTVTCNFKIGGVDNSVASTATMTSATANTASCYYDGTNRAACVGSSCNTTAGSLTLPTGSATVYIGSHYTTGSIPNANGVVRDVRLDPSKTVAAVPP